MAQTGYREESAEQADMYVFHDLNPDNIAGFVPKQELALLLNHASRGSLTNKKHYLVTALVNENSDSTLSGRLPIEYDAVGTIIARREGYHYGCGENHWDSHEESDRSTRFIENICGIIDLDTALFDALRTHGGESALQGYALLLQGNFALTERNLDHYPLLESLLSAVQDIPDPDKKERIRSLAMKHLQLILYNRYRYHRQTTFTASEIAANRRLDAPTRRLLQGFRRA